MFFISFSPDSLVFCENMSAQCSMVSKLCRALVTVVSGAFVLCQLVSPQVALVRECGLTQVTLPSYLWSKSWLHKYFYYAWSTCSCFDSLCLLRFPCAVNSAPHWSQAYLTPSCSVNLCLQHFSWKYMPFEVMTGDIWMKRCFNIHTVWGLRRTYNNCWMFESGIFWPREVSLFFWI